MTDSSHLGQLPTRHHREKIVDAAEIDLETFYHSVRKKYDLTNGECLRVAASVFGRLIGNIAKYAIRHERHGSGDFPGGWEKD